MKRSGASLTWRRCGSLVVLALVLASPLALADVTNAPVKGKAHADYHADAGAILAQALSADPHFVFDLAFERATVYELRLPDAGIVGTRGAADLAPRVATVMSVSHVGRDALHLDASESAAVLLASDPRGLEVAGLPSLAPRDAAAFVVETAAPLQGLVADLAVPHDLSPSGAVRYTFHGLQLDEPLRAHAEGSLFALLTRGVATGPSGASRVLGDTRVLLVEAEGAVADVQAAGLNAVLRLPEAGAAAGGQLVADVAGRQVAAGHDTGVRSSEEGLDLASAYDLQQALLGPDPVAPSAAPPRSQAVVATPLDANAVAAGAVLGTVIAFAAAAAAGLAATGKYGLFALLGPLYARLQHDEVLQNRTREAVYRYVVEHPGVNVSEVVKHFGLGWGATVYHLRVLEKNHLVVPTKQGRQVCYFQNGGTFSIPQRAGISALRNANAAHVARVVLERPGVQQRELCRITALAQPTVSWHLARLEEAGLVHADGAGRKRYTALPPLHELAQRGLLAAPAPTVEAQAPALGATPA